MTSKKSKQQINDDLVLAGHEASHVVFAWYHPELPGVDSVTLREDADTLGHTLSTQSKRLFESEHGYMAEAAYNLAGRVGEQLLFGEVSDLGDTDLENATAMYHAMVLLHGFGKRVGPLYLKEIPTASPLLPLFQRDVHEIALTCGRLARALLERRYNALKRLTRILPEKRTLKRSQLLEILGERPTRRLRTIGRLPQR